MIREKQVVNNEVENKQTKKILVRFKRRKKINNK